jgi:hypothetical protein
MKENSQRRVHNPDPAYINSKIQAKLGGQKTDEGLPGVGKGRGWESQRREATCP